MKDKKCVSCSVERDAVPGKSKCQYHLDANRKYMQNRTLAGKCKSCSNRALPGKARCVVCSEKDNKIKKKYMTKKRIQWKKEGRCCMCGLKLHPEFDRGCLSCNFCRERINY